MLSNGEPLEIKSDLSFESKQSERHIVGAAGQLPPRENLRKFIEMGADLVAFSGGKAIKGPQSSGILCGKQKPNAICSCASNNLLFIYYEGSKFTYDLIYVILIL